jgi:hypothetical protein
VATPAHILIRAVSESLPSEPVARQRYVYELFTLGEYRLAQGNPSAARQAATLLRGLPVPRDSVWLNRIATLAALLLDAHLAVLDKRPEARTLLSRADSALRTDAEPVYFFEFGNIIVAGLWEASGDPVRALAAIRRRIFDLSHPPFLTTSLRLEGRLADLAGDRAGAIRAYRRYLALRSDPEPVLKPQVGQVRAELARLTSEEGAR